MMLFMVPIALIIAYVVITMILIAKLATSE